MYEENSDADLLTRLQSSSESEKNDVLLVLYERYKQLVLKICYYHLADYDAAADVFHDVFLKVMKSAKSLKDPALFKGWLIAITRNVCVDRLRRSSYLKGQEPISAEIEVSCDERIEDRYIAEIDRQKILTQLSGCIRRLDPFQFRVFQLRWRGMRAAQILKALNTNKAELRRSYDRIKEHLESCMKSKGFNISIDQILLLGELDE
jgi:RNA polymerase sigma-70 factor (ECF subfamily)